MTKNRLSFSGNPECTSTAFPVRMLLMCGRNKQYFGKQFSENCLEKLLLISDFQISEMLNPPETVTSQE